VSEGEIMKVSEAVASRRSIRAFTSKPVPEEVVRRVVERAARAPSGGNVQPWRIYVAAGEALERIKGSVRQSIAAGRISDTDEYRIYPENLWEPHRTERFDLGEELYRLLGIPREDKRGRVLQFARNYEMFGAPVGLFCYIDRRMGPPQWSDLGMYLQTLMLLFQEEGVDTCAQEAWSTFAGAVGGVLQPPPEVLLFCGMAIGYADGAAAVNQLHSRRLPLAGFAEFRGFPGG
jgi:nitroreductase